MVLFQSKWQPLPLTYSSNAFAGQPQKLPQATPLKKNFSVAQDRFTRTSLQAVPQKNAFATAPELKFGAEDNPLAAYLVLVAFLSIFIGGGGNIVWDIDQSKDPQAKVQVEELQAKAKIIDGFEDKIDDASSDLTWALVGNRYGDARKQAEATIQSELDELVVTPASKVPEVSQKLLNMVNQLPKKEQAEARKEAQKDLAKIIEARKAEFPAVIDYLLTMADQGYAPLIKDADRNDPEESVRLQQNQAAIKGVIEKLRGELPADQRADVDRVINSINLESGIFCSSWECDYDTILDKWKAVFVKHGLDPEIMDEIDSIWKDVYDTHQITPLKSGIKGTVGVALIICVLALLVMLGTFIRDQF